jgi:hypothetical protein
MHSDFNIPPAFNTPVRTFASGYNWREKISFFKNRIRPSRRYKLLTRPLPKQSVINPGITPSVTLGFTGDVMPIKDYRLTIGDDVKQFFAGVDYLLVNMEGVITDQKRLLALSHRKEIAGYLAQMFPPERTIVYVANNHAGDFGYPAFVKQYAWLKDHFGYVIGAQHEAALRIGDINITSVTGLSNQICKYVAWLDDAGQWYDQSANFNLLLPHWGYELQLYPYPGQIKLAENWLSKWNMIAGNHSHCPQPATAYSIGNERRASIYSMGNFCYHHRWPHHRYGKIAKVAIGPNAGGQWQAGELNWEYTRHDLRANKELAVHLTPTVKY